MTIFVGEGITVVCAAKNPITGAVVGDAAAKVEFFAPPKNPAKVPADRDVDEGPFTLDFDDSIANADGTTGAYTVIVDTTGWDSGKWNYRVTLTGAFVSWEYATFKLDA